MDEDEKEVDGYYDIDDEEKYQMQHGVAEVELGENQQEVVDKNGRVIVVQKKVKKHTKVYEDRMVEMLARIEGRDAFRQSNIIAKYVSQVTKLNKLRSSINSMLGIYWQKGAHGGRLES